jgi:hypothetical protein
MIAICTSIYSLATNEPNIFPRGPAVSVIQAGDGPPNGTGPQSEDQFSCLPGRCIFSAACERYKVFIPYRLT